jgi:hypothetical protein
MEERAPVGENFVRLVPGVQKRLHFFDHAWESRVITDPTFKTPKTVRSLTFRVDFEDGLKVDKTFSVISSRLAGELESYLPDRRYQHFAFTFLKDAPGTVAPRLVRAEPWLGR